MVIKKSVTFTTKCCDKYGNCNKYWKVRDHFHFTGKYRDVSHGF